jgi:C-terminal processing protease CtpA/Prc
VELLSQNSYTLGFADYDTNGTETIADDTIALNGETAALSGQQYTENPVHKTEVIQVANMKIGYLMYNGFNNNFENQLNAAFAEFAAAGVDELVLDLRYNGGGSVQTAVNLGSMVTVNLQVRCFLGYFTMKIYKTIMSSIYSLHQLRVVVLLIALIYRGSMSLPPI